MLRYCLVDAWARMAGYQEASRLLSRSRDIHRVVQIVVVTNHFWSSLIALAWRGRALRRPTLMLGALALMAIAPALSAQAAPPQSMCASGTSPCTLYRPSFVYLLAHPEQFEGRRIHIVGFLHLEFEGTALYLHREDFQKNLSKNGFWVNFRQGIDIPKDVSGSYVQLEGTFTSKSAGHFGMWSGEISDISFVSRWPDRDGLGALGVLSAPLRGPKLERSPAVARMEPERPKASVGCQVDSVWGSVHPRDRIARALPQFAAIYVDSGIVVLLTDLSDTTRAEPMLRQLFANRPGFDRESIRFARARYSHRQLRSWQECLRGNLAGGWVSVSIAERENRVSIGIPSDTTRRRIEAAIRQRGLPLDAFKFERSSRAIPLSTPPAG
jgi:hypothetical protein